MLNFIDSLLNRITMYRLVLYYLIILLVLAAIFGAFGILPYNPIHIAFESITLVVAAWLVNEVFAKVWKTHPNAESSYITALILALIITPQPPSVSGFFAFIIWAAVWAMTSKYLLAIDKKHIFNPAAFAVALTAFTIHQSASWWVGGNIPLLAPVVIGGLLIVRKIQRFDLVLPFFGAAVASVFLTSGATDIPGTLQKIALHTPIFFFAFIMLTEPLTTPPTRPLRIIYGLFVGLLYAPRVHIGPIFSTPELALLAGNIFSYAVSPKKKYIFTLAERKEVGAGIYDFRFTTDGSAVAFKPGQYMEWTLGHTSDGRGNRRYFTVASSPTEKTVHLGVRFYDNASSFKKTMLGMKSGDTILGGQLAGDFTLPADKSKKLAFVAGGIGITPFRSMVKYISDSGDPRDAVLFYSNRTPDEIAYKDVFEEARNKFGMKTVYAITDTASAAPESMHLGRVDAALIEREIPDYKERMFYISGTHAMVTAFEKTLRGMGIPRRQIKIDFFPGFA